MTDMTVAKTILAQLGGKQFVAMTGAKGIVGDDNSLSFQLPKAQKGIRMVRITLNGSDLYDVEFGALRKLEWKSIAKHDDIYADMLRQVFTSETGLYTSMRG